MATSWLRQTCWPQGLIDSGHDQLVDADRRPRRIVEHRNSADRGGDHDRVPLAEEEAARVPGGEETVVGAVQRRSLDHQRAGPAPATSYARRTPAAEANR